MTDWDLRPYEGVGPLTFGMTRDDVGHLQLGNSRVVRRTLGSLVEQFLDVGVLVHYVGESDDVVGLVEFAGERYPSWGGLQLGKGPVADTEALASTGLRAVTDDLGSVWFEDIGIALYAEGEDTYAVSVFSHSEYALAVKVQ